MDNPTILVINPGSTSTRVALYRGEDLIASNLLECPRDELEKCNKIFDQVEIRLHHIENFLADNGLSAVDCDAIAARGGPLQSVPGGVYRINQQLLSDAQSDRFIEHVSKIACVIANRLGAQHNLPSFIVDPVSTDEYEDISRISGIKEIPRKSLIHALNLKAVARVHAKECGNSYEKMNFITAQLGGGCSIAVHKNGRMIDSVDANGEGPFSPERSGGLRSTDLVRFAMESGRDFGEIRKLLTRGGGLSNHLDTTDAREIESRIKSGDAIAKLIYEAMAYQISKHICALAAAVSGKVDAIILTGGLANSEMLTSWVEERVSFLAPVRRIPGEREMEALRDGAMRALRGIEPIRIYPTGECE